jgi:ABC-type transport system substrate-binding protein
LEESGLWGKGGVELSLTLVTSSAPELRAVADAIAEQWELIGIPVETVLYAPGELAQQAIRPRSYQALLFGEVVTSHADLYSFWASSQRTGTGLNVSQFANPSTDRLLAELRSGTSENPLEATARVAADITDAVPAAFLYTPSFLYALSPDISGVVLGAIEHPSDRYRSVAGWYRYQEYVWPLFVDEHKI